MNRLLSGFAGAGLRGGWCISAEGPQPTLWAAGWAVSAAPGTARWIVRYRGAALRSELPPLRDDLSESTSRLRAAVGDALTFARSHWDVWVPYFEDALGMLASDDPEALLPASNPALLHPAVHPLSARRLVTAAQRAWVFGGMGSWNDWSSPDTATRRTHDAVSDALYAAVVDGLVTGVNTL